MTDTSPSQPKSLVQLKTKKASPPAAAPPASLPDAAGAGTVRQQPEVTAQASSNEPEGAAEAAGVLTAVDEDVEGGEEAELPREFDYHSDAYEEEG